MENISDSILAIFYDCMYKSKSNDDYFIVKGLGNQARLVPERLEAHRKEIAAILDCIFPECTSIRFSDLKKTKDGQTWGTDAQAEMLLLLGLALTLLDWHLYYEDSMGIPCITRNQLVKENTFRKR